MAAGGRPHPQRRLDCRRYSGKEFIGAGKKRRANHSDRRAAHARVWDRRKSGGRGKAAESAEDKIRASLAGANLVFITSSFGGGAGTGAAPVVARIVKKMGLLSVAVITTPFHFEGARKRKAAEIALKKMRGQVDALVVVRNDNLLRLSSKKLGMAEAFHLADDVLRQGIRLVTDMVFTTGEINLDFADLTMVLRESPSSDAVLGIGESGNGSAEEAVRRAVESPLLDRTLAGAKHAILNIVGDETLTMAAAEEAAEYVRQEAGGELNLIFGTVCDSSMTGRVKAMLVATGFEEDPPQKPTEPQKKETAPAFSLIELPKWMRQ
ncbi:MAG: cell division FtsZ family protein [Schwartzia sp.]|nr:cell division FtsZ family protein [Schwartzia sp. (in: firmicutes)]